MKAAIQEYPNKPLKEALMDKLKKMIMITVIKHLKSDFNKQLSKSLLLDILLKSSFDDTSTFFKKRGTVF